MKLRRKCDEDSRRIITRTVRFSINKEVAVRKKIKTCSEEPLVVKEGKGKYIVKLLESKKRSQGEIK